VSDCELTEDEIIERHKLTEYIEERMRPIPEPAEDAARADLERHTRELLARFLRDGGTSNAANFKKFEDDARALLAEWEARR
jgi:hypothetical protein